MKKTIFAILGLAVVFFTTGKIAQAQSVNEGIVVYNEVIKMKIELDSIPIDVRAMIPTEQKLEKSLLFNYEVSKYQKSEQKEDIIEQGQPKPIIINMSGSGSNDVVFRDIKNNKIIQQIDFMGRLFLIEMDIEKYEWKLTGNQKMILGYPCQEAVMQGDTNKTTVWFTPVIPVSTGPEDYGNLPGLILELNINNDFKIITAKSIELKPIKKSLFEKPNKGKKMSKKEFEKMVKEKTEEMYDGSDGKACKGGVKVIVKSR